MCSHILNNFYGNLGYAETADVLIQAVIYVAVWIRHGLGMMFRNKG